MAFYDSAWFSVMYAVLDATWWLFLIANFIYRISVPSTHRRYVWVSIAWALAFPALTSLVLGLAVSIAKQSTGGVILTVVLLALWGHDFYRLYRSDEDNWFKRTGKKLRRWARQHMPSLSPMPHGAGA